MENTTTNVARAAQFLREGQLVAFPTETVYGLGGNATDDHAVARIYAAKGRPQFNPLIVHVAALEAAHQHVIFTPAALQLAQTFWPGPLTLVLPRRTGSALSLLVSAGMDTVAVRLPAHPIAKALLEAVGFPLAAPSANRSGRISPTDTRHVQEELGHQVAAILEGGPCRLGIESTVLDATAEIPVILRPGSIGTAELQRSLGFPIREYAHTASQQTPRSPGQLASHYAPTTPVRLHATHAGPDEALLAFGSPVPNQAMQLLNLSPQAQLQEAAANLFGMLRLLDKVGARAIAVMPIPQEGLGIAINDRLRRAACAPPAITATATGDTIC